MYIFILSLHHLTLYVSCYTFPKRKTFDFKRREKFLQRFIGKQRWLKISIKKNWWSFFAFLPNWRYRFSNLTELQTTSWGEEKKFFFPSPEDFVNNFRISFWQLSLIGSWNTRLPLIDRFSYQSTFIYFILHFQSGKKLMILNALTDWCWWLLLLNYRGVPDFILSKVILLIRNENV